MKKKGFLISLLLLFCAAFAQAQQKVYIKLSDGTVIEKYVWEVHNITFADAGYGLTPSQVPTAEEAVDLGLSVKWAPYNLTATSDSPDCDGEIQLFGWGDISGLNHSDELRYFPVLHPTVNIVNDENRDIAKKLWGDKWRLPTEKEIQELLKCTWIWNAGQNGYDVTGLNGNSIFIPAVGKRMKEELEGFASDGYYWTGVYNKDDDETAFALSFNSSEKKLDAIKRFLGLAIRPVYGEQSLEVTSSAELLYYRGDNISTEYSAATIQAIYNAVGSIERAGEYGILWGTINAQLEYDSGCGKKTATDVLQVGENVVRFYISDLNEGTRYKVRPYVLVEGVPVYGEELVFQTADRFPEPKYVDMGTSVQWAEWDVGAQDVGDFGFYFGWGDISGDMTSVDPFDYATGFSGKSIAGTQYDVAHVKWGKKWRMPTEAELLELAENSTWERESRLSSTGLTISGYLVTSKISGNSIFLPAGGYYEGTSSDRVNSYCLFWTAEMDTETNNPVYYRWNAGSPIRKTNPKWMRTLVRAVYAIPTNPDNYNYGGTTPDDPNPDDPTPDDPDPVTPKLKPGKAVDLGLSVKWADYNVGATKETEAGYYIAWGDTVPRTDYSKQNYIHYNASTSSYIDIGRTFNATDYAYDAARHQWGGTWRVPTEEEMSELWLECTWEWTSKNGVDGFNIIGKNGKGRIFLPAAGWKTGSSGSVVLEGTYGGYWTSSINIRNTGQGLNAQFNSNLSKSDPNANPMPGNNREFGMCIRPVTP